ncbi:MerR family transcriptional regulator [Pseudophaeobacter flagellatus]|uniref:MerR family transcriptional regulator n=1 Tax=Pseudophaeobacter flagellatus TaxID=2899119 RepID=UPI001E2A1627|nr:MerR family transcriptional regulator [Pseudophaeobacter flagellatus]MCD9148759.1 chaperone modulator CbpM [Pseudophaeobacter flagellatus]
MSHTEEKVLAEIRRLTRRDLRLWVREGWVRPAIGEAGPLYDDLDVARIRLLCDLRKEMALPSTAVPVVLTLIDRLHQTRRDLYSLVEAVDDQSDCVRHAVVARLRARFDEDAPAGGD